MGCVCSKGIELDDHDGPQFVKSSKSLKKLVSSSRKDEASLVADSNGISNGDGGRERLISSISEENAVIAATPILSNESEKGFEVAVDKISRRRVSGDEHKLEVPNVENSLNLRKSEVPNGFQTEHVVAGWPSWLTAVAGEAVRGWVPRKADSFEKLNKIGQGTYSSVYKARDLETDKIVALKKVRFANMDPESVRFMAREIYILRRIDHPNIVKLEGLIASRMSRCLYLVFEYMEHDLTGLAATPGIKFTEPQIKCYMQQLLSGLHHCHSRGVLHRDIKGSNLLIDNNGVLKLADFGLATFFNPDQKQPLTSRVVTLWYRPPELLLGATEYGVSVDLWSTGCILAELFAGKPIMPGRTEVEQLHKIFKLCGSPSEEYWRKSNLLHATIFKPQHPYQRCVKDTFRDFPPSALALLERLLAIEPVARGTAASALKSEFFTTRPLPCDPSSLPKYPPSKELDAKLRDEEARRQRSAAAKRNGSSGREGSREPEAGADANVDSQRRFQENPKSSSEKYNPQENGGTGFHIDPPDRNVENGFMHSGVPNSLWNKKFKDDELPPVPSRSSATLERSHAPELRTQISHVSQAGSAGISNLSGPLSSRSTSVKLDSYKEKPKHQHWPEHRSSARCSQLGAGDASGTHNVLERPSSSHRKNDRIGSKDSATTGYVPKKNRIHYSGPLMPPGGNLDEMLKEHERQIQQAVRKAQIDRVRDKNHVNTGLSEARLFTGRNGRSDV